MRTTVVSIRIAVTTYEAVPLGLNKVNDLGQLIYVDSSPRVEASQPLSNPFFSTG